MRSIALVAEKGGPGKTTTAINLAVGLARRGLRTLLIDADPQGNASLVMLGGQGGEGPSLAAVLMNEVEAADAIRPTGVAGLDLIPADAELAEVNVSLAAEWGRERRLRLAMEGIDAAYDFVVVDTSPTRTPVNVNVLNYATEILVPVDPGLFAVAGLGRLQEAVAEVRRFLDNRELRISGIVLTKTQSNNVCRVVEARLRETFGPLVCASTIPLSVKVEEAHGRFQAVIDYAPRSVGAKAYDALISEVLEHGRAKDRDGAAAHGAFAADDAA
jgi:chromosome partitioning protein